MDEENQKSKLQLIGSSFVIITGLFVMISMADNITGRVVGYSQNVPILETAIALWGLLIMIAGVWMMIKKDFYKSIFDYSK